MRYGVPRRLTRSRISPRAGASIRRWRERTGGNLRLRRSLSTLLHGACQHSSSLRALPAKIVARGRGQRATRGDRNRAAVRCVAGGREDVVSSIRWWAPSDGLFKEFSAPALRPSNGGRSDAPIAKQLCAVASIPFTGIAAAVRACSDARPG